MRTERHKRILAALSAHDRMNSTAGWIGSPNPHDWHNICRTCICGVRVSTHPWHSADAKAERAAWLDHVAEMVGKASR